MKKRCFLIGLSVSLVGIILSRFSESEIALYITVVLGLLSFFLALSTLTVSDIRDEELTAYAYGYLAGVIVALIPLAYFAFWSPEAKARDEGRAAQKAIIMKSQTVRAPLESYTLTGQVTSRPEKVRGQLYAFRIAPDKQGYNDTLVFVFVDASACPVGVARLPKKGDRVETKAEIFRANNFWRATIGTTNRQKLYFYQPPCGNN